MKAPDWVFNLCVPTLRVADVTFNTTQIIHLLEETGASCDREQLCLFPQLALSGSTCADLFFQPLLARACLSALEKIENSVLDSTLSVVLGLPLLLGDQLYDAVAVIGPQGLRGFVLNNHPDSRYFQIPHQNTPQSLTWKEKKAAVFRQGTLEIPNLGVKKALIVVGALAGQGTETGQELILNPTALPALGDSSYQASFQQFSSQNKGLLAICSAGATESTGEEVFSGLCQIWQDGTLLLQESELTFESRVYPFDPQSQSAGVVFTPENARDRRLPFLLTREQEAQLERAFEIQTAGLMGRMRHIKSEKLVLGLSGGADSSMAFLVCCHVLDKMGLPRQNLLVISMPGLGSSDNSKRNTADLTQLAGINPRVISIVDAVQEHLANIDHDGQTTDVTYENAQARERTQILMDLANMEGGLVVGTGDMSENALGWSTYNGDQMSMYNVNAGLPKTILWRLLVWAADMLFGSDGRLVAQTIVDAPVSPELKPLGPDGRIIQLTENVLGPYLLHDFFIWHALQERKSPSLIFQEACQTFEREYEPAFILQVLRTFYQRFFRHQFKRTAAPDGPRLFSLGISAPSGWRMPADASPALWLEQLNQIENVLKTGEGNQ
jgi:NAD+ synthase (glutamine-hydrolysing)